MHIKVGTVFIHSLSKYKDYGHVFSSSVLPKNLLDFNGLRGFFFVLLVEKVCSKFVMAFLQLQ